MENLKDIEKLSHKLLSQTEQLTKTATRQIRKLAADDSILDMTKPEITNAVKADRLAASLTHKALEEPDKALETQANLDEERVRKLLED